MVMVRMGSMPIPSIKWSVSIDTMINFDGDGDGHRDGDDTCKHALTMGILPIYFASLSLRVQCEWALRAQCEQNLSTASDCVKDNAMGKESEKMVCFKLFVNKHTQKKYLFLEHSRLLLFIKSQYGYNKHC